MKESLAGIRVSSEQVGLVRDLLFPITNVSLFGGCVEESVWKEMVRKAWLQTMAGRNSGIEQSLPKHTLCAPYRVSRLEPRVEGGPGFTYWLPQSGGAKTPEPRAGKPTSLKLG